MAEGAATNYCCCCYRQDFWRTYNDNKESTIEINVLYHGDPAVQGSFGYLESLLRGRGQFEDHWIREELNN
jgi:hypothetical protein